MLGTPETKWGYDHVTSCYSLGYDGCWEQIKNHMKGLYPDAKDSELKALLGMRILTT